jgi:hypothetical protein
MQVALLEEEGVYPKFLAIDTTEDLFCAVSRKASLKVMLLYNA